MKTADGGAFDPETIELLRDVLDDAWASLRPEEQALSSRSMVAASILKLAATGERDPSRLRACALTAVVPALTAIPSDLNRRMTR